MSEGVYLLLKHGFILQWIKVLTWEKKATEMLFMDTVNKAFSPTNCTLVRHSLQKQKVLFQLALNLCILVSWGMGCLSRYFQDEYFHQLLVEAVSNDVSERIHWNEYSVTTAACKPGPDRDILPKHFQLFGYYCPWKSNHAVSHWQLILSDH